MGGKLALFLTSSTARITFVASAAALCVSLMKFAVITVLVNLQTNKTYLKLQDAILTGLLVAAIVWIGLMIARERRKYVTKQVQTVAKLNHELRNALEVILASEYLRESSKYQAILDSVERINYTLDSILGTKPRPVGKQLPLAYRRQDRN